MTQKETKYLLNYTVCEDKDWRTLRWLANNDINALVKTLNQKIKRWVYSTITKSRYHVIKISQTKKSEVYNVVPDFNQKDKKIYPPED